MTKHYCDRCRQECDGRHTTIQLGLTLGDVDLCLACVDALRTWLGRPKRIDPAIHPSFAEGLKAWLS